VDSFLEEVSVALALQCEGSKRFIINWYLTVEISFIGAGDDLNLRIGNSF